MPFHVFDFGEPVSLSEPSRWVPDATFGVRGVFRLFVTGDWPEGDLESNVYLRCDLFVRTGENSSALDWTVCMAGIVCGSASCPPPLK